MRVVCIVQARMGSTRLPGKVLMKIQGSSVLGHVVSRLNKVYNIDEIVVATTDNEEDYSIVKECEKMGVEYFRGSESNVLERYYKAADYYNADIVVRVTSDCPLIDPEVTYEIIEEYKNNTDKIDYISNCIKRTYPRGLDIEVFSFKALKMAYNDAMEDSEKEHVTPYIWKNHNIFNLASYEGVVDYSHIRITLDTQEDFELINNIYTSFDNEYDIRLEDIILLFNSNPKLFQINKNIIQKCI